MRGVTVVGDVSIDVVARLSGPFSPGGDSPSRNSLHGGGQAANTATWLAQAGMPVVLVGRVGDDSFGRRARAELAEAGVDVRLAVDTEAATGTCVVLVGPAGERSMLPDAGANDRLSPEDLPEDEPAEGGHLHVAGYALLRQGSRQAALTAIDRARSRGAGVSIDPSSYALLSPESLQLFRGATLLLPNAHEATALTGERDPEAAARRLTRWSDEVVVKLGARGALWTDGGEVRHERARPLEAPDSTGAGDAFAAGFLRARLAGGDASAALLAGCRLAAEAVRAAGARPVPTRGGDA